MLTIKTLFKDSAIYGAGNFVFKSISFLVFPLYAQVLSVADFGIMELVNTGVGVVSLVTNLGLNNAVQRFYWDKDTGKSGQPIVVSNGLYCMIVWGGAILCLCAAVSYYFKEWLFVKYEIDWIYVLIALITVFFSQNVSYCMDVVRLHFSPMKFSFLSGLSSGLTLILCVYFMIVLRLGVFGFFGAGCIAVVLVFPIALYCIKDDIVKEINVDWIKGLAKYGYPFIFMGLGYWALSTIDRWMLATYTNTTEVGLYSIGFKFAAIIFFLNTAMGQAWSPFFMKLYAEDKNYKEKVANIYLVYLLMFSSIGIFMALFAKEVLMIFTPKEYWAASKILSILAVGAVIYGTTQFSAIGISLEKRPAIFSYISVVVLGLNLLMNVILIPVYGGTGAALALTLSYFCMTLLYFFVANRIHFIPYSKVMNFCSLLLLLFACVIAGFFEAGVSDAYILLIKVVIAGGFIISLCLCRKFCFIHIQQ